MTHEWKIGDWCEYRQQRGFVYLVGEDRLLGCRKHVHFVTRGGTADYSYTDSDVIKHLPDCDSWDWQPPKPIEPPEGYRLLTEGEIVHKDDWFFFQDKYWDEVTPEARHSIGEPWSASTNVPFARKIEPKVRPMTRDEFLAAWKQRGFCPLIDSDDGIDTVLYVVVDNDDDDQDIISLNYNGWKSLDDITNYKFASDETYLTIEE